MRKIAALCTVLLFALCCFASCDRPTYEDGYIEGYSDGYSAAESDMEYLSEEEFEDGYDIGYEDGYFDAEDEYSDYDWLEHEAAHYAREYSEWHPVEAMEIIDAYQNNEPLDGDGIPSEEEYLDAIESLYRFYEYFYCAMYDERS